MRAFVYSKTVASVSLTDVIRKWPRESGRKNLKRHIASCSLQVSCISMLAHPIDEEGGLVIKKIIQIMCIDPGYTVYQACAAEEEGGEEWNLADTDTYDLAAEIVSGIGSYKRVRVQPVSFINEKDAHAVVSSDLQKVLAGKKTECDWYNNSHGLIDEFVLNTTMTPCWNCKSGLSGKRFSDKKIPLCRTCRPADRHEGANITTPKVIDLEKLGFPLKERVFTREHMVHEEYVTFMAAAALPFVKGEEKLDEKYTTQFLEKCKSAVYDIETVTVDRSLKTKIPDEIVTITASLNTGTTMNKLVMFTRKVPEEWEDNGGTVDTNQLLGDLRKPGQTPLPSMRVIVCPTEAGLVETFKDFLLTYKPHFLVSYNGHGFDNKFLIRASVSNRLKETFHGALNHFSPLVKINNTDPIRKVDPRHFMRPHGKHCKGLITTAVMEVTYDSFPCLLSIDLFPINDTSLNDACAAKKVDGCKLEGVAHSDIPRLYYGRRLDFFKYALLDVVITTDLYWKDRFNAYELFMELEELVSTPWNMSVSRQKTMTAQTTTYVQFHTNGFIRRGKLRPKRVLTDAIVDDLAECIYDRSAEPKLDETTQILVDFVNSHCKCNTLFKTLPKMPRGPLTEKTVDDVLKAQIRRKKATDPPYSTVDAAMLLFYLVRGSIDWVPFEELTAEFASLVKDCPKKTAGLANFCLYLVRVRRCISPLSETSDLVWKEYKRNHKTDTVIAAVLERFIKDNYDGFIEAAKASKEYPRPMAEGMSPKKVATAIKNASPGGIKLKFLPYDGAMILFNNADINLNNPVCVLDFRSQYPNGMRAINLGIDTNLSLGKVLEYVEVLRKTRGLATRREAAAALAAEFVHVCFTREEDDTYDWLDFLDHPKYLSNNCQFFVRNVTSIQNHQFKAEIDSRVIDKLKAEDTSLPSEVRKKHLNRSTAKKVNINSRYGVIQSVINPKFQATVTGVGRRSIQRVTGQLKELIGTKEMYGDSVPGYTPLVLKEGCRLSIYTFDKLAEANSCWITRGDGKEELIVGGSMKAMTHEGWRKVVRVIRHKTGKKIYRVRTDAGLVDVTADHSLLNQNLEMIKPEEVVEYHTSLAQLKPESRYEIDDSCPPLAYRNRGETAVKTQEGAFRHMLTLRKMGFDVTIEGADDLSDVYHLAWTDHETRLGKNLVKQKKLIHDDYTGYVYDIETETGTFNAGIGDIILKNTDSCFTYVPSMDVFKMVDMTPEDMYEEFQFGVFGVSAERMREIHAKYYPVDKTDPKAIRNAGGGIAQELYEAIAPALSTEALELDAERKSLCPMFLPSMKKYTAYNCATRKSLTKGLSMHNKSAIPMTKTILAAMVDISASCWNEHDLASSLYRYLGQRVTVPIELHLVDPRSIAKPCSINLRKVKPGSKQNTLVQSMVQDFIFEKIHVRQVAIYPEKEDKDWSLCDVLTQSCDGREHVVKIKYDVLKEVLTILRGKFCRGVCEPFEALLWGEFCPDKYTPEVFAGLAVKKPGVYKPASFSKVMKKFIRGDWLDEDVSELKEIDVQPAVIEPARKSDGARKRDLDVLPGARKRRSTDAQQDMSSFLSEKRFDELPLISAPPKKRQKTLAAVKRQTLQDFWEKAGFKGIGPFRAHFAKQTE